MKRIGAIVLLFVLVGCARIPPSGTAHIINFAPGHMPYYAGYGFFTDDKGCFITTFHQKHFFAKGVPRAYDGSEEYRLEFLQGIPELDVALFRANKPVSVSLRLSEDIDREIFGKKVFIRSGADMLEATVGEHWITYTNPEPYIPGFVDREFLGYRINGGNLRRGKSGSVVVNSKGEVFAIVAAVQQIGSEYFGVALPLSNSLLYPFLKYHQC